LKRGGAVRKYCVRDERAGRVHQGVAGSAAGQLLLGQLRQGNQHVTQRTAPEDDFATAFRCRCPHGPYSYYFPRARLTHGSRRVQRKKIQTAAYTSISTISSGNWWMRSPGTLQRVLSLYVMHVI